MTGCLAVVRFRNFSFLSTVIFPVSFSHIHFVLVKSFILFIHPVGLVWSFSFTITLCPSTDRGLKRLRGRGEERKAKGEMERSKRKDEGDRKEKRKETANEEAKEH